MSTNIGETRATLTSSGSTPKPDEVKRLEKAYEISKEMFGYTENIIKSLDEKSRNSVSVASAITAFALLIHKPADLNVMPNSTVLSIGALALLVAVVYVIHFLIVRPLPTKAVDPADLKKQEEDLTTPEEILYYNFSALTDIYTFNLETIRIKSRLLNFQTAMLLLTLCAALIYIALPNEASASINPPASVIPNHSSQYSPNLQK